ncbi:MAG: S8 family peptidase [Flavobacteriaceae bacterium]|nr:S8 family peptidase [Flavobacteriaceae bacterium]MCI5087514.1 S8 family peptidase [Flavobacteriaceae bacterium]
MKHHYLLKRSLVLLALTALGCKALPPAFVTETPVLFGKKQALSQEEKKQWGHMDPYTDSIPGMSVHKAYAYLKTQNMGAGAPVVVAILDSGIDLKHEDLSEQLWTNPEEVANNQIDDDGNGYVDDLHGYNFLGDSYHEQVEVTRIVAQKLGDAALQAKATAELEKAYPKALGDKAQYEQILMAVETAHETFKKAIGKDSYSKADYENFETNSIMLKQQIGVLAQMYTFVDSIPEAIKEIKAGVQHFSEKANYNLNKDFDGRAIVGDNPYDITDVPYGNGNPQNLVKEESHGSHVAGIVAAKRDNDMGMDGVAQNVKIMALRAVPNGDEYDKDIALGIRYAVDNGARIINASFGKSYSPNAEWVYEAIQYAAQHNVLIVHAAGNEGENLDDPSHPNYPNDQINNGPEIANNVITVGALGPEYGENLVADFSNYGAINVDVFAPGADIYSCMPGSEYAFQQGTSMAAPGVAGVAALVWSYYPNLKAQELKKILMLSGLRSEMEVVLPSDPDKKVPFHTLSVSGRMVNAYNALILAKQITEKKLKLKTYDFTR